MLSGGWADCKLSLPPPLFQGLGGFSGFIVSMLVAFLTSTRKIHTTMSGYQVLRSVLQFLGKAAGLKWHGFHTSWQSSHLVMVSYHQANGQRQAVGATWPEGGHHLGWISGKDDNLLTYPTCLVYFSHHGSDSQWDQFVSQPRSLLGEWGWAESGHRVM